MSSGFDSEEDSQNKSIFAIEDGVMVWRFHDSIQGNTTDETGHRGPTPLSLERPLLENLPTGAKPPQLAQADTIGEKLQRLHLKGIVTDAKGDMRREVTETGL